MATNYVNIESVSNSVKDKVKQTLKFRTGNFVWRIRFSSPLNPATVNNKTMYVTSLNQTPLKTYIKYDTVNEFIEIEPLEPYAQNESYILTVSTNVRSQGGKTLKNDIKIQFSL